MATCDCLLRLPLQLQQELLLLLLLLLHMSLDLCWRQLGACRYQCRRVQWLCQRSWLHALQQLNARLVPLLVVAHATGEAVGLLRGPGTSAEQLD